jgi:hypothetical protein
VGSSQSSARGASVARSILACSNTSSSCSVPSSAEAIRIDARVGLVGKVRVVGTGRVATTAGDVVGAEVATGALARVGASQASTGVGA